MARAPKSLTPDLPSGLETDPLVYDAMRDLALASIAEAKDIIHTAAPQQKLLFLRIILPRLMGSLTQGGEDEFAQLREQMDEMTKGVRDALASTE